VRERVMGRLGWRVGDVGYGMWGIAGGSGGFVDADLAAAPGCLDEAVALGCTFFDTAASYGRGVSELLLGRMLRTAARSTPDRRLWTATKVPPANGEWPPRPGDTLAEVFPPAHVRDWTQRSLDNLGVEKIDLLQFHVWEDRWAADPSWPEVVASLKADGLIGGFGLSVNRWEPANCLAALDTGLVDAVQVIYNIFDQAPEDELFPRCQADGIAVIARVPYDEGSLTGMLSRDSSWPAGDFRNTYFGPENLGPTVDRVEALQKVVPDGMTLPELALRFVLHHPAVSVVIPGMRSLGHVRSNLAASDAPPLPDGLLDELRAHRWDRTPTAWSG
jgi:aryl-alcohol dehydrogenase-like predicted oxidoreductase